MKPSSDLFNLIKSMHQTEKRYFKIYASKHIIGDQNKYVLLFDAIDQQAQSTVGEYDEDKIKALFKKEKFIRQIHVAKNYLYHMILKSLHVYQSHASAEAELKELLHYEEILFAKQLYSQCPKVLKKAKKLAVKYEKQVYLLDIIAKE